jgi:hypothetical protein
MLTSQNLGLGEESKFGALGFEPFVERMFANNTFVAKFDFGQTHTVSALKLADMVCAYSFEVQPGKGAKPQASGNGPR